MPSALQGAAGAPLTATDIAFTPTGTIAATNTQSAVAEVASEAGGGSGTIASILGYTDPALVYDAGYLEASGAVSISSTALTVTGGTFSAADNGKYIHISRRAFISSVSMTAGASPTITHAAFATDAYVGYHIVVSGAGASGWSFITTIASINTGTSTATLAGTSTTTVSGVTALIQGSHSTTIASASGTGVTLTAGPAIKFATADVVWGTDNRAAASSAATAAVAAGVPVYQKAGKALVVISAANPYMTTNLADSILGWKGAGSNASQILFVWDGTAMPVTLAGLWRMTGNSTLEVEGVMCRYFGLWPNAQNYGLVPYVANFDGGSVSVGAQLTLRDVAARNVGSLTYMGAGSGAGSRKTHLYDVDVTCHSIASGAFTIANETASEYICMGTRGRPCKFTGLQQLTTGGGDNDYNQHLFYIHPQVWYHLENVETNQVQVPGGSSAAYVVHASGGDNDTLPNARRSIVRGCRFYTGENGLLTSTSRIDTEYAETIIEGNVFKVSGLPITLGGPAIIRNNRFLLAAPTKAAITAATANADRTGGVYLVDGNMFTHVASGAASSQVILCTHTGSTWEICNNSFIIQSSSGSNPMIGMSNSVVYNMIDIHHNRIHGLTGCQHQVANFYSTVTPAIRFNDNMVTGVFNNDVLSGNDANDAIDIEVSRNQFRQTTGRLVNNGTATRHGCYRGTDNVFGSSAAWPQMAASASMSLTAPRKRGGTNLTVASNVLNAPVHANHHPVSGGGTVNNVYMGATETHRAFSGDLYLEAVTNTFDLAHNASGTGNIRTKAGTTRTVAIGEVIHLRLDERNGIVYEV